MKQEEIEIPEGHEAKIVGNKVVFVPKESEDEMIRKHIIEILERLSPCHWNGNEKSECIAYLEKQKPLSTEETELNSIAFLEQLGYTCVPPEAEKRPAECIEDCVRFEEGFKAGRESGLRDGQKYVLNNLDSYGLYKPAEWSEEDENAFERLKEILNIADAELSKKLNGEAILIGESEFNYLRFGIAYCLSWLELRIKSLRPQPHWKPSKEQMRYLLAVINEPNNAGAESCHLALQSLYSDLKNL